MRVFGVHARSSHICNNVSFAAVLLLALAASRPSHAATFCITAGDVAALQSALATASNNGDDDLIELQAGQYSMPNSFLLDYEAAAEHHDITIEGGYGDNFGNPCGTPPATADSSQTILDGGLLRFHLAAGVGSLSLKAVTVQSTLGIDPNHAPIEITAAPNSTGNITIENSTFSGNGSTTNAAIYAISDQGAVVVKNSLFTNNISFAGAAPVRLGSQRAGGSLCSAVINSTFSGNISSTTALDVATPMCLSLVANDIFWGNGAGGDVAFANPPSSYVISTDIETIADAANTQSSDLLNLDPLFRPDFSLQDLSPLRDKGSSGGSVFAPGTYDVIGNPRSYGANPDIGAFEIQDVIFADGFENQG